VLHAPVPIRSCAVQQPGNGCGQPRQRGPPAATTAVTPCQPALALLAARRLPPLVPHAAASVGALREVLRRFPLGTARNTPSASPSRANRGPGRAQGPQPWERRVPSATQARHPCLQPRQQPWDCAAPRRLAPRPSPLPGLIDAGPSAAQDVRPVRKAWRQGSCGAVGVALAVCAERRRPPSSQPRSPPPRGIRNLRQNHFFSPFTGEGWATEGSLLPSV
jgi:hypothetical protein